MHPRLCCKAHLLQLLGGDVLKAAALQVTPAIFYFAKINYLALLSYHVNLAPARSPVLVNNGVAVALQVCCGGCLSLTPVGKGSTHRLSAWIGLKLWRCSWHGPTLSSAALCIAV